MASAFSIFGKYHLFSEIGLRQVHHKFAFRYLHISCYSYLVNHPQQNALFKTRYFNLSTQTSSIKPSIKPSKIETIRISDNKNTSQLTFINSYPYKGENQKDLTLSRISSLKEILADCKLMIFDKDGTLTHCDKCFGPWIEDVATQLEKEGWIRNAKECLEKALLYDLNTQRFDRNSVMIRDTSENVKKALAIEAFRQTNKNMWKKEGSNLCWVIGSFATILSFSMLTI